MKFLNKETELLLQECIDNSYNFPQILADKLQKLSIDEENRLRNQIHTLVENGYFSKLQWADNVPWFGSITEDGYDYFHKKNVYVRSKLKGRNSFKLLDQECEKVLEELYQYDGEFIQINGTAKEAKPLEQLEKFGYIKFGKDGISYTFSGDFACVVTVTQAGKNYFQDKDEIIEEILILDENHSDNSVDENMLHNVKAAENESSKKNITKTRLFETKAKKNSNSENYIHNGEKIQFCGILGNNCGTVVPYTGSELQKKEKGYIVENGIPVLRGFAKISEIARASRTQYEQYQRDKDQNHVDEIAKFLTDCKNEAKFLPEVILSVNDSSKASMSKYNHKAFSSISDTAKGAIDNLDYYVLEVSESSLNRVDGNHRIEAGKDADYYIPFAIIVWNYDSDEDENILLQNDDGNNNESEAFLFYILNNTAKRLEAEENFKGLVKSINWSEDELSLINKHLPLLKHFNENYANNPLVDKEILCAPLSQICDILAEINSPDIDKEYFDIIFRDTLKILNNTDKFIYCREKFLDILFQLAFYARFKSDDYETALRNLGLVDEWLKKYKYINDTFTKASKIYDVAYKFISVSPKYIFMAMEYKSEKIVEDYNSALSRAVHTINNTGGNIEVEAYPIMTGKGKTYDLIADIYCKIDNCSIFIADITEANPNVMYELGIAYDKKKTIIMVREKEKDIKVPSDIISDYYYNFNGITELEHLFVKHITEILISDYGAVFPN